MVFDPPLVAGRFVERLNRFAARVAVGGREALAHVPNSGRMRELLVTGAEVRLSPAPEGSGRKTRYDLTLVRYRGHWVGVDSRFPNVLFAEAVSAGKLAAFRGFTVAQSEVHRGSSRFDFLLTGAGRSCYVETKSVNLVEEGTAMFPDAPTVRGTRHVEELTALRREGLEAAVVFVIQRADARRLIPHDGADPRFGAALRTARKAGVNLLAYTCRVSPRAIVLDREVPVIG